MKKIRVAALAMAIIMLALCAVSCSKSEKLLVNCTISVMIDGELYLDGYAYQVQGTVDEPPTVLQAASEAFMILEIPYEVEDNGNNFYSISFDGNTYAAGMTADGSGIGFWEYTADGVAPKEGQAGINPVLEGQHILFTYQFEAMNEATWTEE